MSSLRPPGPSAGLTRRAPGVILSDPDEEAPVTRYAARVNAESDPSGSVEVLPPAGDAANGALMTVQPNSKGKIAFQSFFMSMTVQLLMRRASKALSRRPKCGVPVVSIFALGVGVMDDQAEARAPAHRRPLQHLEIAVGVAERRNRAAADVLVDADRLAGLVVDEVDLRQAEQHRRRRRASRTRVLIEEPTTCSGGTP